MTAYVLGNLLGRFVLSYALVWLAMCLTLSRLNWRGALQRTNHWSGLIATTSTFLIGLIATHTHGASP